ncbi:MAG: penicillin-binding protein activator LpoB [Phycisphaerales bacterium]|nr:penicillin-binding protein activator LpoB [Phycisphaerales bacterium]
MRIPLLALPLAAAIALGGCGQKATYIETGGTQSIVSVGEVDIQDIQKAASGMLDSMLATGVLRRAQHQPARVVIDRVVNDTSSRFDTGEVLYRMREQLVNSGQAEVETAYGSNAESQVAQDELKRRAFLEGKTASDVFDPDFTLTGKITQIKRRAGNVRQTTYTFRLTLTNMRTGREAWTKTVDMTKQGTKNSVGF